ncbi:plant/F9H3-4 protein, partial [Trifolium medium]|nr:plant/F9H3-4 protein [Trifolium medium]
GVECESDSWSDDSGSDNLCRSIPELAESYPELMTLKSVDLSPASWMAVSW